MTFESHSLWDAATPATVSSQGFYVAISGNTGAGKSTIINRLVEHTQAEGHAVIGISERSLHHQYLPRMFADPKKYAFPIQVHFILQRYLVLLRQLELGRSVVIERSHFDDAMFLREHAEAGNISPQQLAAYNSLHQTFISTLPVPDVIVILNPPPEVSFKRVTEAEERGDRPREFPSEEAKKRWISRWFEMYRDLHTEFRQRCSEDRAFSATKLIELNALDSVDNNVTEVIRVLSLSTGFSLGRHSIAS